MVPDTEDEGIGVPNCQISLKRAEESGESVPGKKSYSERINSVASVHGLVLIEYGIHRSKRSPLFDFKLEFFPRWR